MSFLDEFDKRAEAAKNQTPPAPPSPNIEGDDQSLLEFADLIRTRQASFEAPKAESPVAKKRDQSVLLKSIQNNQEIFSGQLPPEEVKLRRASQTRFWLLSVGAVAAMLMAAFGLNALVSMITHRPPVVGPIYPYSPNVTIAQSEVKDEFAGTEFPKPVLSVAQKNLGVELPKEAGVMRVTRVHGLVMSKMQNAKRWEVLKRGSLIRPGETVRASSRLNSGARLLLEDGSSVSVGPASSLTINSSQYMQLTNGELAVDLVTAAHTTIAMTLGHIDANNADFTVRVLPEDVNDASKNLTMIRVKRGEARLGHIASGTWKNSIVTAGNSAALTSTGLAQPSATVASAGGTELAWVRALEMEANANAGIGELVAKTEKLNEKLPLEIASHSITVTCVDQVARTFVDEVFVNNTDRQLEATFYYPLPADAAISEFAMYIEGKRVVGEVLEQHKARQVFEYIVRQQKDPALLEWAGGNLFKMRVFPIEPRSEKRVQLGYTQILPIRNGTVTYTYPLYSEKLLKNPLKNLSIEFRAQSSAGLSALHSPTHVCGVAIDPDGKRGALGFTAKKYSPTGDFSATYRVPDNAEIVALGNVHPDDADPYLMLQLAPKVTLPAPNVPERLLVIVDGSASAGAQDYAVATEFAASCADLSADWEYAVLRGGQNPTFIDLDPTLKPAAKTSQFVTTAPKTAEHAREALESRTPLGATDLLATFEAAAKLAEDGRGLQIIYVGDGIDTVNELSSSALVDKITALLGGKFVQLSTVAVGSTYEGSVMRGLANALNGTFTRVEGASDVHAAAGQVFENFYRPRLWNAKVTLSGVATHDVHSESLGSLPAGDSAVLFARVKNTGTAPGAPASFAGKVFFTADSTNGRIDRTYDFNVTADTERSQFLPRLWARAHNEALTGQMGLGSAREDAKLKDAITDLSVKYQIMSPYTSFLVLENEDAYKQYGIKRTMKRQDWMSGESKSAVRRTQKDEARARAVNKLPRLNYFEDEGMSYNNYRFAEGRKSGMAGEDFGGLDPNVLFGDFGDLRRVGQSSGFASDSFFVGDEIRNELALDERIDSLTTLSKFSKSSEDEFVALEAVLDLKEAEQSFAAEAADDGEFDMDGSGFASELNVSLKLKPLRFARESLKAMSDSRLGYGYSGRRYAASYSASSVFVNSKEVKLASATAENQTADFTVEPHLKPLSFYKKWAARDPNSAAARLHLVLSLQADSNLIGALNELKPLLEKHPASIDLRLLEAEILLRSQKLPEATAALDAALKIAKDKPESEERLLALAEQAATLLYNSTHYAPAAERFAALARSATKADDAARHAHMAENNYHSVRELKKGLALWEELFAKWPDSTAVKQGLGQALLQGKTGAKTEHPKNSARGLELVRAAAKADPKFNASLLNLLFANGLNTEGVEEARKLLDSAKDHSAVYAVLAQLAGKSDLGIRESKRMLQGKITAAQYAGLLQYWAAYSIKGDKELRQMIAASLKNETLPAETRLLAANNLLRNSSRDVKLDELIALSKVALKELKTEADFNPLVQAAHMLHQKVKFAELLELSDALINRPDVPATYHDQLSALQFYAYQGVKRDAELRVKIDAKYFAPNSNANEEQTRSMADTLLTQLNTQSKDFQAAAKLAAQFEKRFPNSFHVPRLYSYALGITRNLQTPAERDTAIEALAKQYPAVTIYAEHHARSLAKKKKFSEAADVTRAALKSIPAQYPPKSENYWRARKSALIQLLARISSQDTKLREAFLVEASANEKTQHKVQREWTEGALACLREAADLDAYASTLLIYTVAEPNDPDWAPRLAGALMESGREKEGRAAFEALSDRDPSNVELAFTCRKIALAQKDEIAAAKFFDRAFETISADRSKLIQFASGVQASNPTWALKAYERLVADKSVPTDSNTLLNAANTARDNGRQDLAVDFYFRILTEENSYYPHAAMTELATLANQEYWNATITVRASGILLKNPSPTEAIATHLLMHKLKALKQDKAGAAKELDAALKHAPTHAHSSYLSAAIMDALRTAGRFGDIEDYALTGAGNLNTSERRQLIRTSLGYLSNDAQTATAVRMLRKLLEQPDYSELEDRRNLVGKLVADKEMDQALSEVRKLVNVASHSGWATWHGWEQVIDAHNQRNESGRAAELALEAWHVMKEDSSYSSSALQKLSRMLVAGQKENKLKPEFLTLARAEVTSVLSSYFMGERVEGFDLNYFQRETWTALNNEPQIDALALAAESSDDSARILAAAHFANQMNRYLQAERIYLKGLTLEPKNQQANERLLSIQMHHSRNFEGALKTIDALKDVQTPSSWMINRVTCLGRLGRLDEARKVCRELMKRPDFARGSPWTIRSLAHACENFKDFGLAVELWEMALKNFRAQNNGRNDHSQTAEFYVACGMAHKAAGNESKALDCFLRGMSVLPRTDSSYTKVLDAALTNILVGKTLAQAVATLENNVATEGGDKPHLRIAFAEAYKRENKVREQLKQLNIAANLLPKDMTLRKEVIAGYEALQDSAQAIAAYQEWAKLDPQNIEIYRGWGQLYELMGKREDALLAWATMAEVRPRESEGYQAYAQKLTELRMPDKAAAPLRQAVKYRPTEFALSKQLAEIYQKLLSAEEAKLKADALWKAGEEACRKAMIDVPDDPAAWLNLGQFLEAQKRIKDARELYEKIATRDWPRFKNETVPEARKRLKDLENAKP